MAYEKDPNELGALWNKTGAKGDYMTGTIEVNGEKTNVVCFAAKKEPGSNRPDWRVMKSQPKAERPAPAVRQEVNDSDVPF